MKGGVQGRDVQGGVPGSGSGHSGEDRGVDEATGSRVKSPREGSRTGQCSAAMPGVHSGGKVLLEGGLEMESDVGESEYETDESEEGTEEEEGEGGEESN